MKKISLRNKIITSIILTNIVLGISFCFIASNFLPDILKHQLKDKGKFIARSLSNRSVMAILTGNWFDLKYFVKEERELDPDVAYAFILDLKGNVLAHTFGKGFPVELKGANRTTPSQISNVQLLDTGEGFIYDIAVPILVRDEMIGTARVGLTEENIRKTINNTLGIVFGATILAIILSIFIGSGLAGLIVKPVKELHRASEEMIKGNLDVKTDIKTGDEIQQLAETFNLMTTNLKERSAKLINEITERKRAEEMLRKAHDELETTVVERTKELSQANLRLKELDRLKSMFIASMSHELRTPLNSIIGFTGIILKGISGEITEDQRKELTMVKNSAHHLLVLINDVIDVSKIEAGKVELVIEEFNLAVLMQEANDSFKVAVDEKGLKLSLETPERLIIKSDERRAKQVIMNFVSNAVKFTDRGEIEIKVVKKDGSVEVSVADTGIGIKKEDMGKLFRQFSRIYVEGRPLEEGTGLGLYLSKKIADLLGGQLKAESEFGKGSIFTFTLPLKYREVKHEKDSGSGGQ